MSPAKPPHTDDDDFDLKRLDDISDPLAQVAQASLPPLRSRPLTRPRTRSEVTALRGAALGLSVLYQIAWIAIIAKRGDLPTMSRSTLLIEIAIPVLAAVWATVVALAPGRNGMGISERRLAVLTLLAPLLFLIGTLLVGPDDIDTQPFAVHALGCFGWTLLLSAVPLVFTAWASRRVFVTASRWHLAALGIGCAALAASTMSIICSVGSPAHVIVGHGGMMLVAGIAGALLGRRIAEA